MLKKLYDTSVILEIARGDSIEKLLEQGIIEERSFWAGNHAHFRAYGVTGGTTVDAEVIEGDDPWKTRYIVFGEHVRRENGYGFGHGQREIYAQRPSGCFLINEVFVGKDEVDLSTL